MGDVRRWLARRLRPFVEQWDPIALPGAAAVAATTPTSYFLVKRLLGDGRSFALYHDVDAHEAVRRWTGVIDRQEQGRMEFWHNGVLRDVYTNT